MNIKFKRTVFIPANMETVWNTLTSDSFEGNFFPEINRRFDVMPDVTEVDTARSITWRSREGIEIEMTRKDLNVDIDRVEIKLVPCAGGVIATLCVVYSKLFEKHFFIAHRAVRSLFSRKLHVLKSDCIKLTIKHDILEPVGVGCRVA